MHIRKQNLVTDKNFSIDVVVKNNYTHSVQLTYLPNKEVIQIIPFDPTDRSVAGSFNKETIQKLGDDAEHILNLLSETLISKLGAKEFMIVPSDVDFPEFKTPEKSTFDRLRHANRAELQAQSQEFLANHKELTKFLDDNFHFVTDETSLVQNRDENQRYDEINNILEQARFTSDKQEEYKKEELQGKKSRFKSEFVKPLVMVEKHVDEKGNIILGNIVGMIRGVLMRNGFVYLSDEVLNQEILPLDKFPGDTEEKQKQNRELFLLSYLINKACAALPDQKHAILIAASGRVELYEQAGLKNFPLDADFKVVIKFGPPGPALIDAQEKIKSLPLTNHSWKQAIPQSSVLPESIFAKHRVPETLEEKVDVIERKIQSIEDQIKRLKHADAAILKELDRLDSNGAPFQARKEAWEAHKDIDAQIEKLENTRDVLHKSSIKELFNQSSKSPEIEQRNSLRK